MRTAVTSSKQVESFRAARRPSSWRILESVRPTLGFEDATPSSATPRTPRREAPPRQIALALNLTAIAVFADLYTTQPILPILSHRFCVSAGTARLTISLVVLLIAVISAA